MRILLASFLLATPVATLVAADTLEAVQTHIRPGYAAFAETTRQLAAIDDCGSADLLPAFHASYDAWMAVEHLHLGPSETDGRALALHFWPDPKGLGWKAQRALLTGDPAALTPEAFAQQSVAARGLPALERLLYPVEALPGDPCPLILATADDMARLADELAADWGPYGDLLLTAGQTGNTAYLSQDEATQALFTQLVTGLEFAADRRLGRPLGTFDKPRPDLADASASARPMRNIALSLQALRDLAVALHPDIPKTTAAIDHALALADALGDPDFAKITDPQSWLKVQILQTSVRAARDVAIAELGPALGVTLGFNSQDGD